MIIPGHRRSYNKIVSQNSLIGKKRYDKGYKEETKYTQVSRSSNTQSSKPLMNHSQIMSNPNLMQNFAQGMSMACGGGFNPQAMMMMMNMMNQTGMMGGQDQMAMMQQMMQMMNMGMGNQQQSKSGSSQNTNKISGGQVAVDKQIKGNQVESQAPVVEKVECSGGTNQ